MFDPDLILLDLHMPGMNGFIGLFLLRGLLLMAGHKWARSAPLNYLSYTVDTVLLTAALMLMTIIRQYPFVHGWLTAKVLGYNQTCYKLPDHKPVVDTLFSRYSGVSGLTST